MDNYLYRNNAHVPNVQLAEQQRAASSIGNKPNQDNSRRTQYTNIAIVFQSIGLLLLQLVHILVLHIDNSDENIDYHCHSSWRLK